MPTFYRMEVCNRSFKASDIIGIGPLNVEKSDTMELLWFFLYLKDDILTIQSTRLKIAGVKEITLKQNAQALNGFMFQYLEARKGITVIIQKREISHPQESGTWNSMKQLTGKAVPA